MWMHLAFQYIISIEQASRGISLTKSFLSTHKGRYIGGYTYFIKVRGIHYGCMLLIGFNRVDSLVPWEQ